MCFSVFAAEKLNLQFNFACFYESKTEPGQSWQTPLMQLEITGAHSLHEN